MSLELAASTVLERYRLPRVYPGPLPAHGGFSGARLWRVATPAGPLCLRAWPQAGPSAERLQQIHTRMDAARLAGLKFVPAVLRTPDGRSWVTHGGRLWELTEWMPGRADFHDHPTAGRLEAACTTLARLHGVWARAEAGAGPCPAVRRRLDGARAWAALVASGWRPAFPDDGDPVHRWARRAWRLLPPLLSHLPRELGPWGAEPLPLHACLCDIWHDHVLFDGDAVAGLVDYGSVKVDNVAADLARLLGSLVPDDAERTAAGLRAYRRLRPLSQAEQDLVAVLDRTGIVLGVANWLRWLYHERRRFADRAAVAGRLAQLVARIEGWTPAGAG